MGQPRRENPSRVTGISWGRDEMEASFSSGMKRRDLLRLRIRPIVGQSRLMIARAAASSAGVPTSVHSKPGQEPHF